MGQTTGKAKSLGGKAGEGGALGIRALKTPAYSGKPSRPCVCPVLGVCSEKTWEGPITLLPMALQKKWKLKEW